MGMFDNLICHYRLPGTPPSFAKPGHVFQTKSLGRDGSTYTIAADGSFSISDFSGGVHFYDNNGISSIHGHTFTADGEDYESAAYRATFVKGRLAEFDQTEYERRPALSKRDMDCSQGPDRPNISLEVGRRIYVCYPWMDGLGCERWPADKATVMVVNDAQVCVRYENDGVRHKAGTLSLFDRRMPGLWESVAQIDEWRTATKTHQDSLRAKYDRMLTDKMKERT